MKLYCFTPCFSCRAPFLRAARKNFSAPDTSKQKLNRPNSRLPALRLGGKPVPSSVEGSRGERFIPEASTLMRMENDYAN